MAEDLVNEIVRVNPLALQAPLHVGDGDGNGVDIAGLDFALKGVDIEPGNAGHFCLRVA